MQDGDYVHVTVNARAVGPGRIVDASRDPVQVIVARPQRGPYQFAASRTFFVATASGRWTIDMPAQTLHEFFPDE